MPDAYFLTRIQEIFSQPWVMEPFAYEQWEKRCLGTKAGETLARIEVAYQLPLSIAGGVATIPISGVLLKTVPGWVRYWDIEATGYDEIRQMLALAVADPRVERIELRIDSPGGQVAGGMETADAIRAADGVKPVTAVVEDLAASGAYWLATSARRIEAGRNAEIGSIGVYMVYQDWSRMFESAGVKTIVIRSGEHKGMGVPGAPITEAQIAAEQEIVDQIAGHFVQQVAVGRRLTIDQVKPLATGRVWLAPAALELGLIDAVGNGGQPAPAPNGKRQESCANESAAPAVNLMEIKGDTTMPDPVQQPVATAETALAGEKKRVGEIKAAFPKDAAFALEAIEQGWDVTAAKAQYCDRLMAGKVAVPGKTSGAAPLPYEDSAEGPASDFLEQAAALAKEEKITKTEAMKRLAQEQPSLHQAFLDRESGRGLKVKSGAARGRVSLKAT
jgi:signal peptide peptidase SppA